MSKEVIDKYVAGGLSALRRMEQASLHASEVSHETLMRIIRQNEDTEYGQKYDFRNIHSYEEYTLKVPFSEYSDYEPYIERMVLFGAKKLITASDVLYFAHTSGSSGASKMIPRTKEELDILFSDIFMRAFGLREWTMAGKQGIAEMGVSGGLKNICLAAKAPTLWRRRSALRPRELPTAPFLRRSIIRPIPHCAVCFRKSLFTQLRITIAGMSNFSSRFVRNIWVTSCPHFLL